MKVRKAHLETLMLEVSFERLIGVKEAEVNSLCKGFHVGGG